MTNVFISLRLSMKWYVIGVGVVSLTLLANTRRTWENLLYASLKFMNCNGLSKNFNCGSMFKLSLRKGRQKAHCNERYK